MLRFPFVFIVVLCINSGSPPSMMQNAVAQDRPVRIVLAGDSTVTDHAGWGRGFQSLFHGKLESINLAQGGRSSRSFREEGFWQKCLDAEPDYLLIQFGHNDQPGKGPERESAADGAFREHLADFVDEARARNIKPILITPLTRRRWNPDGTIKPTLAEYAEATSIVASQKQVPLIDLHRLSITQCEAIGATAFRAFEPMTEDGADHTHLNADGSLAVAWLVVSELVQRVPDLKPLVDSDSMAVAKAPRAGPRDLASGSLRVREASEVITISDGGRTILVYNKQSPPVPAGIESVYHRSGFLHPVLSPKGKVVTATFPVDHAHQHGVFSAWVSTSWNDRELDFWNMAKGTGRVLHQRVLSAFADEQGVGFEVDLIHRAEQEPVVDVLRERWRIKALPTDGSYHAFDLQTTQLALTAKPLVVQEYHYGGFALRGPVEWLSAEDRDQGVSDDVVRVGCRFLNDQGSDRVKGNHEKSRWVAMSGNLAGDPVSISVLCHNENLRAPQSARLHPSKPYFCYAPCVEDSFVIDRDHPLQAKYRFLVTDAEPDPDWIESQWQEWNRSVTSIQD